VGLAFGPPLLLQAIQALFSILVLPAKLLECRDRARGQGNILGCEPTVRPFTRAIAEGVQRGDKARLNRTGIAE